VGLCRSRLEDAASSLPPGPARSGSTASSLPPGINGSGRAGTISCRARSAPAGRKRRLQPRSVAFDNERFEGQKPKTLSDFFDLKRFPGSRGLKDSGPKYNLEMALLPPTAWRLGEFMPRSPRGRPRPRLRQARSIKSAIVWWRRTNEPADMLARGDAAMTTALKRARLHGRGPSPRSATIWDGQLISSTSLEFPRAAPRKSARSTLSGLPRRRRSGGRGTLASLWSGATFRIRRLGRNSGDQVEMRNICRPRRNFARDAPQSDPDWWAQTARRRSTLEAWRNRESANAGD